MTDGIIEAFNDMHKATEVALREQLGLDGSWVMRDLPWMKEEFYNQLVELIGDGNYKYVSGSRMSSDDDVRIRATLFVNEQGLANIRQYAQEIHT